MASSLTLTLLVLIVPVVLAATIKRHTLTISEKGAVFRQATNVDEKNRVVYIRVPAHRDVPESKVMYEFTTGRVLRCTPSIERCYLTTFDTRSAPGASEEEHDLQQFAKKHSSPRKEEKSEKDIRQDMVVTEKIEDTKFLTKRMRKVLGNHALYREEPLPKGAELLTGTLDLNKKQEKRQFGAQCPGGAAPIYKYARTTPSCNRMVLCSIPTDRNSCGINHYHGIDFYQCLCCPGQTKPDQCIGCIIMK